MRVSAAGNMPLQGLVKPPAKPVVMILFISSIVARSTPKGFPNIYGVCLAHRPLNTFGKKYVVFLEYQVYQLDSSLFSDTKSSDNGEENLIRRHCPEILD